MSPAAFPEIKLILVQGSQEVRAHTELTSQRADLEGLLDDGHKAHDWRAATRNHDVLPSERSLDQPGQVSFRSMNGDPLHLPLLIPNTEMAQDPI